MTNLRNSLVLTAGYFAFVFSLGRFSFLGEGDISLHGYLYILMLASFAAALIVPPLRSLSMYAWVALCLGVYLIIRGLTWQNDPAGGEQLYLTLTEAALLTIGAILARDLDQQLKEYEGALAEIGLPKSSQKIYAWDEAGDLVKTEFIRSRRYNHPLSLMVIEPTMESLKLQLNRTERDIQRIMMDGFLHTSLARIAAGEARRTDLVIEMENEKRILVLFPETKPDGLGIFAERIQALAKAELGLTLNYGIASFPKDALTFEDLQQKALFNLLDPKKAAYVSMRQE